MEGLEQLLWPLTAWHWLALGLILLSIEMAIGTFDLLWVAVAAGVTAIFAAIAPAGLSGWQAQLVFFAVIAIWLIVLGRTALSGMRRVGDEHPTLNRRMQRTIGKTGVALSDFDAGSGRVRLGDTDWSAETVDGSSPAAGTSIIVEATSGNALKVRKT